MLEHLGCLWMTPGCVCQEEKNLKWETAAWLMAIYARYSWFYGPPPLMISNITHLHNESYYQHNVFSVGYVLQDITKLEDLSGSGLRGKHCLSVFGQQTNILPVVCTVNHIMLQNALQQTCRLPTPPTVTH